MSTSTKGWWIELLAATLTALLGAFGARWVARRKGKERRP